MDIFQAVFKNDGMRILFKKLKLRWEIESNVQVIIIFFVFACTGLTAVYIRKFVFALFGITESDPFWFKTILWLLTMLPLYYIFLLIYGAIFGQFRFFWGFSKKMVNRLIPNRS